MLLYRGNNIYDDTRMVTSPEYKQRYTEITHTSRKITRYLAKCKEQLRKEVEQEESSSSSANTSNDTNSKAQSPEKKDADEQSDIDLEDMLENSESDGNNVQTDVELEQLDQVENIDQGTKTDNVQIDTEECVIGELSEGTESVDNNSKPSASEEKETDDNKQDENQVTDKKQDDTVQTEKPINDITEQNDENPEDMQIEQQSNQKDEIIENTDENRKVNDDTQEQMDANVQKDSDEKLNDDKQEQMDVNVQKDSDKPKRRISTCGTNAAKMANKLLRHAKSKIKGSWEFVNKQRAERAKATKCFVCGKQNKTLQKLELHVWRKHKAYHYKCTYCRKKYLTRAGRNKHEMYHTIGYRFKCKKCEKTFMFEGQYDKHMSVHTKDNRYICRKKGCRKDYGSTRARNYHERQHSAKAVYCSFRENPKGKKCNQQFFSKQHLDQHYQGTHGEGWHSKCGKHFSWPAQRTMHENACTECKKIKKQQAKQKWKKKQ